MDSEEGPPPTKIAAIGYQYCPHCEQAVSKRTYRRHISLQSVSSISASATVSRQSVLSTSDSLCVNNLCDFTKTYSQI